MSILSQDMKRLDNISKAYWKTSGEVREMWGRKWYQLVKQIGGRISESKRLTADTRKIH
jgi:hypothetical protein